MLRMGTSSQASLIGKKLNKSMNTRVNELVMRDASNEPRIF